MMEGNDDRNISAPFGDRLSDVALTASVLSIHQLIFLSIKTLFIAGIIYN